MDAELEARSVLLVGAGRLGGALLDGWSFVGGLAPSELMIQARSTTAAAERAVSMGALLNPSPAQLGSARVVVLAVKPQSWRAAAQAIALHLDAQAVIVSLMVGVTRSELAEGFGGRRVARAMPITAVAIGRGVTTLFAPDPRARASATAVLAPVSRIVEIDDEALIYPATAVSGSAPGYLYAFVEALEAAAVDAGLSADAAASLVRGSIAGAAELMVRSGADPGELRRQVASPGGTTQAALAVMADEGSSGGLAAMMRRAVEANMTRAQELADGR